MFFEFLLTSFLWRKTPAEMQEVSPEEYSVMSAWTHVLIDGVHSIFDAFTKDGKNSKAADSLKDAAQKAGIDLPNFPSTSSSDNQKTSKEPAFFKQDNYSKESPREPFKKQVSSSSESINLDGIKGKNLQALKNPQVTKAARGNGIADRRFEQYEQMGLLDLCVKQMNERLDE